jgi:beta-lactamase superfamily II metal-dependent hydrolase
MTVKIISKPVLIGATAVALACGIVGYAWREEHRKPVLEVYVFNLKSGSSVFVRTPDDKRILINGGANSEVIRELTDILPFYSRRIDMIVATDSEGKDLSGLIDVLDRYTVDKVVVPGVSLQALGLASSTDQIYATFLDTVKRLEVPVQGVSAGDVLDLGQGAVSQKVDGQKVTAEILFPIDPAVASSSKTTFQYSKASAPEIILKISYGDVSLMLLGNATTKVQKFLVSSKSAAIDLGANVLIVPHSASASSLSGELMDKMRPEYLVYSQAVTASSKKSVAAKDSPSKNKKVDPFYFILDDKRFNVKEKGTVNIESDGIVLKIYEK